MNVSSDDTMQMVISLYPMGQKWTTSGKGSVKKKKKKFIQIISEIKLQKNHNK